MNRKQTFFSYCEFTSVNANASSIDYAHALAHHAGMEPADLVALCNIAFPPFVESGGGVFLKESFVDKTFDRYKVEGKSEKEIQYWMNLLYLSGVFEGYSADRLQPLADLIAHSWEAKLRAEFPSRIFEVKKLVDSVEDEVAVTFCEEKSAQK